MNTALIDFVRPTTVVDAHADDPRPEIIAGLTLACVFFLGLIGWSAFAPMDAAIHAHGDIVVSGRRQSIQSAEGGVISAIAVHDSDRVRAGQVLLQFAPAEARAEEAALSKRWIELQAELARLDAEQLGQTTITPPEAFASLDVAEHSLADNALATEQKAIETDYGADAARRASLRERMAQSAQQIIGYQRELAANQRQKRLNDQELAGVRDLAAQGYAPMTRVRALEQSGASLDGQAGGQAATIGQLRAASAEARMQIAQGDNERGQQLAEERRRAEGELGQVEPKLREARERLRRTDVRAPVSGSVVAIAVNTIGGVVAPGQRLMDIVPDRSAVTALAIVKPSDAEGLVAGRPAKLRLPVSRDGRSTILQGVVSRVSSDAVTDERTGQSYFTADITVVPSAKSPDQTADLRPGLPVEVIIPLRKRTALQYWTEPLTQSFWGSLHER